MSEQTGKTSNERMTLKKVFEDRKLEPSFVNNLTKRLFPDDCKEETDPTQWPEIRLTKLQEEFFNDPMFWETKSPQNLIFQGATSAGKTLLGEVAAYIHLKNFYQSHRARSKVVFLVPLKVLVTARYKALSTDFKNINVGNEKELRIYVNVNQKMSIFAEKECPFSPDSIQVYTALTTTSLVGLKPVKP